VRRLSLTILWQVQNPRGAQMILFPLVTAWMWFQIFTVSPPSSSRRLLEDIRAACFSLLPVPIKGDRT
jgi:hypothetical protein